MPSDGSDASSSAGSNAGGAGGSGADEPGRAVQHSARSSSASIRALKRTLAEQMADRAVVLVPQLSPSLAFTRSQLRNAYLRLIFHAPFTKSAHNAEQALWAETTHKLVAAYRSRIAKLEKEAGGSGDDVSAKGSGNAKGGNSNAKGGSGNGQDANSSGKDANGNARDANGNTRDANGNARDANSNARHSATPASLAKKKAALQKCARVAEALRQFLVKEEAFWRALAEKMAAAFRLTEATPSLQKAGIAAAAAAAANGSSSGPAPPRIPTGPKAIVAPNTRDSQPTGLARLPSSPAELDATVWQMANLPRHKERLLEILHRILVFCGDLARYSDMYRDVPSGAGVATTPAAPAAPAKTLGAQSPNRGPGRKAHTQAGSGAAAPTTPHPPPDFASATDCYTAARLLLPSIGNPSNQLAVIATAQGDAFGAVYHSFRALCVKVPFDNAKANLSTTLGKAVDNWARDGGPDRIIRDQHAQQHPRSRKGSEHERKKATLKEFVVLHGLFYTHRHPNALHPLAARFRTDFQAAVEDKTLPAEVIVRILVTSLAASWTARLWRRSTSEHSVRAGGPAPADQAHIALSIELQLLQHLLALARVLFTVATQQAHLAIEDAKARARLPPSGPSSMRAAASARGAADKAAENITAVMRRILPALRIAAKWLKAHLDYIERCQAGAIARAAEGAAGAGAGAGAGTVANDGGATANATGTGTGTRAASAALRGTTDLSLLSTLDSFWASFVEMGNTLRYAFPFDALPSLGTVGPAGASPLALEEDRDLRGFIPTRKGMGGGAWDERAEAGATAAAGPGAGPSAGAGGALHPNEEHLMRIADILVDAKVLAESEACPIGFDDERNVFVLDAAAPRRGQHDQREQREREGEQGREREPQPPARLQPQPQPQPAIAAGPAGSAPTWGPAPAPTQDGHASVHTRHASASSASEPDVDADAISVGTSAATEDVVELAMRAVDGRSGAAGRAELGLDLDEYEDEDGAYGDGDGNDEDGDDDDDDDDDDEILIPSQGARARARNGTVPARARQAAAQQPQPQQQPQRAAAFGNVGAGGTGSGGPSAATALGAPLPAAAPAPAPVPAPAPSGSHSSAFDPHASARALREGCGHEAYDTSGMARALPPVGVGIGGGTPQLASAAPGGSASPGQAAAAAAAAAGGAGAGAGATTAQDLLLQMLNGRVASSSSSPGASSAGHLLSSPSLGAGAGASASPGTGAGSPHHASSSARHQHQHQHQHQHFSHGHGHGHAQAAFSPLTPHSATAAVAQPSANNEWNRNLANLASIWSPAPGEVGRGQPVGGGVGGGAGAAAQQQQQQQQLQAGQVQAGPFQGGQFFPPPPHGQYAPTAGGQSFEHTLGHAHAHGLFGSPRAQPPIGHEFGHAQSQSQSQSQGQDPVGTATPAQPQLPIGHAHAHGMPLASPFAFAPQHPHQHQHAQQQPIGHAYSQAQRHDGQAQAQAQGTPASASTPTSASMGSGLGMGMASLGLGMGAGVGVGMGMGVGSGWMGMGMGMGGGMGPASPSAPGAGQGAGGWMQQR